MIATSDNHYPRLASAIAILLVSICTIAPAQETKIPKGMRRIEGKYHTLITDLPDDQAREVLLRMEPMVEEYQNRTRDFSGRLNGKMPFLLFRRSEDYQRAGGMVGTAGVFNGKQLMAIAGEKLTTDTWHTIQHEGFHQFAYAVMGGELPSWVNEGLAEYFGEAIYTGDNFVSGSVPAFRLKRIREMIEKKQYKPVSEMMQLSQRDWNAEMSQENYDQAWAMVHFLAHGDDGKYQKPFGQFIVQAGRGVAANNAWQMSFGSDRGFEDRWAAWWMSEQRDAEYQPYATAGTQMLTTYLSRASVQKLVIPDITALVKAIESNSIRFDTTNPLPPGLAQDCDELIEGLQKKKHCIFEIASLPLGNSKTATQPAIVCRMPDGTSITGTFKLRNAKVVESVRTDVARPKPPAATKPAK